MSEQVRVSGRRVVFAIFGFGVVMTALVGVYWEFYTRPFRDLQVAISEELPRSSPVVIGGKHKSHKNEFEKTLRIVIRIPTDDFDPEDASSPRDERVLQVVRIAAANNALDGYEALEVRLIKRIPEAETPSYSVTRSVSEWQEMLEANGAGA